jgi:hypothetical protein
MLIALSLASIITRFEPLAKSLGVLLFLLVEAGLVGCVAITFLQTRSRSELSLPALLLPGLFVMVAFAESWSLFGGLVPWANLALIILMIVTALLRRRLFVTTIQNALRNTRWINLALLAPCAVFAALNALTNGFCHDTLLYHLAAVRWVAEFGSVPGLANLHGRLGFNTALDPLAALFGSPFGEEVGREYANPVIIVSVCAVLLQGIRLRTEEFFTRDSIYACLLFLLGFRLLFSECLSSPQPDMTGAGLSMLVAWYLRELVQETIHEKNTGAFLACLLACSLVVMFKLSYAVLGLAGCGLAIGITFLRGRRLSSIWPAVIMVGLFSIPWVGRGYITSGYPLYPSDLGRINFDWTVPIEAASSEKDWVLSWAREPFHNSQTVLMNADWFRPWVAATLADPMVLKSMVLGLAGIILIASTRPWLYRRDSWFAWVLLVTPVVSSLLFWFLTAPDPRFAEGTIWLLAADVAYLPFAGNDFRQRFARGFLAVVIIGFISLELAGGLQRLAKEPERFPNYVGKPVPMVSELTYSGLAIWVPAQGQLTGPWNIPATPRDRFDPRLELRGTTLREGFRMNLSRPEPKWKNGMRIPGNQ